MRPRDLLDNGEAHPSSRNMAGLCAPIEALDHPRLFALWNGRTGIADHDLDGSIVPCVKLYGRSRRGVLQRIVEQLPKSQSEQLAIGVDRQDLRNVRQEMVTIESSLE